MAPLPGGISGTLTLEGSETTMSAQVDAASIARLSLHNPTQFHIQHSQTVHRLALVRHWNIPTGARVLEIGCGQGDCTTVLASAVGEHGSVIAVDPADLDYGVSFRLSFFTSETVS